MIDKNQFRTKEDVLKFLEEHKEVKFVRFFFPDILGRLMNFTIPAYEMEAAFQDGKGFDGSSIEGMVRIEESDLRIMPDPKTFNMFPWTYKGQSDGFEWNEALVFGDIINSDGSHSEADTRYVLKKALERGKTNGFDFFVGPEPEFFLFGSETKPEVLDKGGYFFGGKYGEIRKEVMLILDEMGIRTEYDHHEVAHSQHEIDLRYQDALTMADNLMLFKYLAKRVAKKYGVHASFMPKPIIDINGSGMHVHQSIWKEGKNMFFSEEDEMHLSDTARYYMAGIMKHSGEISAVLSQWINSYKRLRPGYEAPVYIVWGQKNRSAFIRVPEYTHGKEAATRIELRSPDPACNPYLALAVMYRAGLEGIARKYELTGRVESNIFETRSDPNLKTLPGSLEQAVELMSGSELVKDTLGEHVFTRFVENKRREIKNYENNTAPKDRDGITEYELQNYLPVL